MTPGVRTKGARFELRVSEQEREVWKAAAAPLSVAAWLRELAQDAVRTWRFEESGQAAQVREREKIKAVMRPLPLSDFAFKPDPKKR